jgi:hypothetical protein
MTQKNYLQLDQVITKWKTLLCLYRLTSSHCFFNATFTRNGKMALFTTSIAAIKVSFALSELNEPELNFLIMLKYVRVFLTFPGIDETVKIVESMGGFCKGYKIDISKKEEVYKAADEIRMSVGDVSIQNSSFFYLQAKNIKNVHLGQG